MRELPHKLKIKLDTHGDFIAWMKALKHVTVSSGENSGDERALLRKEFEDEARKLAVRYTKQIEELQTRLAKYEGGLETEDSSKEEQAKVSSSSSSQDTNKLLREVATLLSARLNTSKKENKELRKANVELEVKVDSLETKLAGLVRNVSWVLHTATSSSSSSSSSDELRQIFDKIDTEKKGSLSTQQTIEMVHTLELNLKEEDMLDVISDGESRTVCPSSSSRR